MSKVTTRVGTRKLNQNQAMPNNEQGVDTTAPTAGTSSATSAPAEPMSAQEMMRMMTQAMVSSMQEVVKEAMRKGTAEIAVSSHAASTTTASPTTSTELWRHGMQVTPFDGTLLDLERFVTDIRRKLESVTAPEKDKVDFVLGHLGVAARRYCSHVKFETAEALLEYIMNVYGVKNSKNNALREIIQAVADPKISARHFKKVMLLNVPKAELTDDLVRRFIVLQAEDKGVRDVAKELCKDTTEMTWIDALNELVESMPSKVRAETGTSSQAPRHVQKPNRDKNGHHAGKSKDKDVKSCKHCGRTNHKSEACYSKGGTAAAAAGSSEEESDDSDDAPAPKKAPKKAPKNGQDGQGKA
uniref:Gag n=2 Tax=Capsaspora owczarzaki TaxID=192875 RepID=W4P2E0_9EUKA|nr:TPA: Gag [Capsaspora owczarzaki]